MNNIQLILAYDGTNYLGWQKTKMGPSVEDSLESILSQILQHKVHIQAASRTDAGVHAMGQVVNFLTDKQLELSKFQISLNKLLPKDIVVKDVSLQKCDFHPTLDCLGKEYHYHICYGRYQLPHGRHYMWHYPYPLNIALMEEAALILTGKHDFKALCNSKKQEVYKDHMRTISSICLVELKDSCLKIEITGSNFLYKMARNIVGSMVYAGTGKITLKTLKEILASKKRDCPIVTAPAHGLSLQRVFY